MLLLNKICRDIVLIVLRTLADGWNWRLRSERGIFQNISQLLHNSLHRPPGCNGEQSVRAHTPQMRLISAQGHASAAAEFAFSGGYEWRLRCQQGWIYSCYFRAHRHSRSWQGHFTMAESKIFHLVLILNLVHNVYFVHNGYAQKFQEFDTYKSGFLNQQVSKLWTVRTFFLLVWMYRDIAFT